MANRERGELRLEVSGRSYTLRLTVGACCETEDRSGKDLDALIAGINAGSVTDLRWVLWAALQAYHGMSLSEPTDVGTVIDAMGGPAVAVQTVSALMAVNVDEPSEPEVGTSEPTPRRKGWRQAYLDARVLGLSADQFWALSLKELWRELAVATAIRRREHDRDISLAWWSVALTRQKRLPPLEKLLTGKATAPRARGRQTWQDMKAALQALTGYGKKGVDGDR